MHRQYAVYILASQRNGVEAAITREKQIKKWNRIWKLSMIEKMNPEWRDLSVGLF